MSLAENAHKFIVMSYFYLRESCFFIGINAQLNFTTNRDTISFQYNFIKRYFMIRVNCFTYSDTKDVFNRLKRGD